VRYLILSDIHANWEALEAILADAGGAYDQVLCCGDLVGYGADPNAATAWVRSHAHLVVRGNHDKAAVGSPDLEWFNPAAREAILWTQRELTPVNAGYLRSLPQGPLRVDRFQILHGSPLDEDEYLVTTEDAARLRGYLAAPVSFFGHTHVQGGFLIHGHGTQWIEPVAEGQHTREFPLSDNYAALINPGSVGQPRDGDPRAAYAIYDADDRLVLYKRSAYNVHEAQRKILAAGLPETLAARLAVGA